VVWIEYREGYIFLSLFLLPPSLPVLAFTGTRRDMRMVRGASVIPPLQKVLVHHLAEAARGAAFSCPPLLFFPFLPSSDLVSSFCFSRQLRQDHEFGGRGGTETRAEIPNIGETSPILVFSPSSFFFYFLFSHSFSWHQEARARKNGAQLWIWTFLPSISWPSPPFHSLPSISSPSLLFSISPAVSEAAENDNMDIRRD